MYLNVCVIFSSDWNYRGDYNNDDDSDDKTIAKGWNYHQGPVCILICHYRFLNTSIISLDIHKSLMDLKQGCKNYFFVIVKVIIKK